MASPTRMSTLPALVSPATAPPAASPAPASPTRRRRPSLTDSIINARPPLGALAATGEAFGSAPSLAELRRNSASSGSVPKRGARRSPSVGALSGPVVRHLSIPEMAAADNGGGGGGDVRGGGQPNCLDAVGQHNGGDAESGDDEKKLGAGTIVIGWLRAFWGYFTTPLGFCVIIYMLNVVAWGGMLFLLLCNAAPAMCTPTCDDINSPRRVWIEIDSQILNALFCVTGFGLVPWRFRDLFYLLQWRCFGQRRAYLHLQEINRKWYRPAPPSPELGELGEPAACCTVDAAPAVTGTATTSPATSPATVAPPTGSWKLDYVIWLYVWNTFFQCCLSGFMWGMDRRRRPSWTTGLFVGLACTVAFLAGGQVWWETRKVRAIEHAQPADDETSEAGEKAIDRLQQTPAIAIG